MKNPRFPVIASTILARLEIDQSARKDALVPNGSFDPKIDESTAETMKDVIRTIGWPTIPKVGPEASHAAELLVRHCDHDLPFQERCLKLLEACKPEEIDRTGIAYLTDRVLVNRGCAQRYGTQFYQVRRTYVHRPIADAHNVDARRKALGLNTLKQGLAEYRAKHAKKRRTK